MALAIVVLGGVAWAATIQCRANTKCFGTKQADTMKGTGDKDFMSGKPGSDTIYGYRAVDFLSGGEGSDKLYLGPGGYGYKRGSFHLEHALGGPGSDEVYGGEGFNDMSGGTGSDKVYGGPGRDYVDGGPPGYAPLIDRGVPQELDSSDDYLYGGAGTDLLSSGFVNGGVDHIYGEDGDDTIDANQGADIFITSTPETKDIVDCGAGNDTVYYDPGVDVVNSNCEVLKDTYGNHGT